MHARGAAGQALCNKFNLSDSDKVSLSVSGRGRVLHRRVLCDSSDSTIALPQLNHKKKQ
jgi:hypothetical protein